MQKFRVPPMTSQRTSLTICHKYIRAVSSPNENLKAHTICPINDGLNGRFRDSASAQFNEHAVSDFAFGHGCGILYHAASSELFPKENISGNASVSLKTVHGFGKPEQ